MRQVIIALLLLLAATAARLTAETISQHEPTLFDPYREPARPLSQGSHWVARTQRLSNITPLFNSHAGQVPESPAQLIPLSQAPLPQRNAVPLANPIYNGVTESRSYWTGIGQHQRRFSTVENNDRFYRRENQRRQTARSSLNYHVRGLVMTKDNSPMRSFAEGPDGQLLTTLDADMDSAGGLEILISKPLPDQTRAEFVYWGLFTAGDSAMMEDSSSAIGSTLDISGLNYGTSGDALANQFSGGQALLQRDFQYHNLELNWGGTATGEQVRLEYLAGFRYFKASEDLAFQLNDIALAGQDDNHLFGFQVGALLHWQPQQQLEIHTGVKFGIFANAIDHQLRVQGPEGFAYSGTQASAQQLNQALQASEAATLGQIDLGFTYHCSERLRLTTGYRIVAVTGLSLPSNQWQQNLATLAESPKVHTDGSMMLHGAYLGLEYDF